MEGGGPRDGGRETDLWLLSTVLLAAPALWVDLNVGICSKEGCTEASEGNPSGTNTTWFLPVWLFPGVCPQMSCEIRRSGEDLATVPEAEGREVGEALRWSTLSLSRLLFIQSSVQRPHTGVSPASLTSPL